MDRRRTSIIVLFLLSIGLISGCNTSSELEWHQQDGYEWAELQGDHSDEIGFQKLTSEDTGITFANNLTDERIAYNRVLLNGSGVAAGDMDGDGLTDLYFTSLDGSNKLYKNLGDFEFEDVTDSANVAHDGYLSTGAVFADVDGNGTLDLLVSSINKENSLYLNDGNGRFRKSAESGLGAGRGSMTMALADVNNDGFPDLYITHYKERVVQDLFPPTELNPNNIRKDGELLPPFDDHLILFKNEEGEITNTNELGETDEFYLNNGDGTFQLVTNPENMFLDNEGNPLGFEKDFGLTARFYDLNRDGFPDLYVCNDFWTPDRIWINQGNGTFRALEPLAIRNSSFSSMSVDFSDINRDRYTDIFTVEMLATDHKTRLRQMIPEEPSLLRIGQYDDRPRYNKNSLYLNRGDDTYSELSYYSGLAASDWSWATRFLDVDLDGFEDVVITTGFMHDLQDIDTQQEIHQAITRDLREWEDYILRYPHLQQQNKFFRNNGDLTFSEASTDWGFDEEDISHGMALADLNNDGTLDLVINRMNQEAVIYQNKSKGPRIALRLKAKEPNTQAIGAKVRLYGGPVFQEKGIEAGGDYLSGSDQTVVFAADSENKNHKLEIIWPGGTKSEIDSVQANRYYKIDQDSIPQTTYSEEEEVQQGNDSTYFRDISGRIDHSHHEESFDDFGVQPLLPYKLSQEGPGVLWIDIDQDGDDDLLIGSGKGGQLAVYLNDGNGEFESVQIPPLTHPAQGDQTAIVGWTDEDLVHIVIGVSGYEASSADIPAAIHYQLREGRVISENPLPATRSVTGSLAAADYDMDGQIDLFVGGRFIPGHYPADVSSQIFRNIDGQLQPDERNQSVFKNIGLVTSAVFADYDQDDDPDLLVSTEWGPVKLFENNEGEFTERTQQVGLNDFHGLWNGIAVGDLNNDGYPDFVAANRGLNSSYQVESEEHPLRLYYTTFGGGTQNIFDSYYDQEIG
ncbi:MAG: VCBS repeat-containing protein, partial [Balneolaceae bacterium]|nr:VCBS repeat-containing protein [Balneolaceae bacterium]